MDSTKTLKVIFTADGTVLSAAFDDMQAKSAATQKSVSSLGQSVDDFGKKTSQIGASLTKTLTLPIVGVGAAAVKMATDFQQQMTYVRTDAGDTTDNIDKLSQSVLTLAHNSQFGPDQLAEGLYHLASLGLRGADAMNALNTAQQMASVGGADLESTASALGAALVTGIKGVQDYSQAAGTLDAIIGAGNMRMQDLVGALGTGALPVFKNAGLSITDFGAALATLTDNGMQADEAATRLKMTISLMEAPSSKAKDALSAIGLASNQLGMDMQTKGLIPALEDLQKHLLDTYGTTAAGRQQTAQALTEMFGGGRSSAAIQTLIDQVGRVQTKFTQIGNQSGEFSTKVAEQQETASAKIKTAWSGLQADLITMGGDLLPQVATAFGDVVKKIDELTQWWDNLSGTQQKFIEKTALMIAVVGPGLSILGKFIGTFGTIMKLSTGAAGGISKLFGGLGAASSGAGTIAGVGEEVGGLGLALGPVGVGLGAVALAALGGYVAFKKFESGAKDAGQTTIQTSKDVADFHKLANDLGVQLTQTSGSIGMYTLSQVHQKDATNLVKTATDQVKQSQDAYKNSQDAAKTAADNVAKAQQGVKNALDKYGDNSPQYQKATDDLAAAEDNYNQKLADEINKSLDAQIKEGDLAKAKEDLQDANKSLSGWEDIINGKFATGIKLAGDLTDATIGIAPAINSLQGSVANLQNNVGAVIQMTGGLQGASSKVSLQGGHFASGTDYAPGGWSLVGEKGPELVHLPRGSQVKTNSETKEAMSSSGSVNLTVQVGVVAGNNVQDLAATIYRELQRLSRANGFNGVLPNIGVAPTG